MEGAFADIHEFQPQPVEAGIRMFIKQPHPLCCINGRAAAQRDNHIRLEGFHGRDALLNGFHRRIRFHFREDLTVAVLFPFSQVIQNLIHISQLHHHGICYDKGPMNIRHIPQVLNRIFFKIDLGWNFKPLHTDPPPCDALLVDQIHGGNIGSGGIPAEGSAAQGQGRNIGVVNIPDGSLGRRRVDNNTSHLHFLPESSAELPVIGMNHGGMSQTAQLQHILRILKALFFIPADEIGQYGGQLFQGKGIFPGRPRQPCQQNFGFCRDIQSRAFCDGFGRLPCHGRIHCHFFRIDDITAEPGGFFFIGKITVVFLHI